MAEFNVLNSFINSDYLYLYLDVIKNNQGYNVLSSSQTEEVIQVINSLLTNQSTLETGLQLLKTLLPQFSEEKFEQKVNFWCIQTLKAFNILGRKKNPCLVYEVLEILAQKCHQSTELSKLFSSQHLIKLYDTLNLLSHSEHLYALKCVKKCLELYPGPSGQSIGTIERFLRLNNEATDKNIIHFVGICHLLLQQVKRGTLHGASLKSQWTKYHCNLIEDLNSILEQISSNKATLPKDKNYENKTLEVHKFSNEPINILGRLYIRFNNLINYLVLALRFSFPAPKCIAVKKVIKLIERGFGFNVIQLERSGMLDKLALSAIVPKIQQDFLDLLDAIIATLGRHLKVYASLVMDWVVSTLNWTSISGDEKSSKLFLSLRIKSYNILILWCETQQHGSYCESVAETLITEILNDIFPTKHEITLEVLTGARKHLTKKARRLLNKTQNDQSIIGHTHQQQVHSSPDWYYKNANRNLCNAALCCLQKILLSSANFLQPPIIKSIYTRLLQICSLFYELPMDKNYLYFESKCRIEIFNILHVLLLCRHFLAVAPVDLIHASLKNGQEYDKNIFVRNHCSKLLKEFEHIIRPQKGSMDIGIKSQKIQFYVMENKQKLPASLDNPILSESISSKITTQTIKYNNVSIVESKTEDEEGNESFKKITECNSSSIQISPIALHPNLDFDHEPLAKKMRTTNSNFETSKASQLYFSDEDLVTEIESSFVDELA